MSRFVPLGRLFFAISLGAFGILQFIYHDFVPGRGPAWPAQIPGRLVWAYVSGAALIAASAAIISRKQARSAAIVSGTMIFLWVVLLHIPRAASNLYDSRNEWTAVFEALAFSGLALLLSGAVPGQERAPAAKRAYARAG
ncbi:MAG: hypothetical protein ACREOO_14570 [bacterium]